MTKPKVMHISPIIAVGDMRKTVDFYAKVLGFGVLKEMDNYSIVTRDGCEVHLVKADDKQVLKSVRKHTSIYVQVKGIEKLWNHVKVYKRKFKVRDLFDQSYGMKEFHIQDPNGCLILVGEEIR